MTTTPSLQASVHAAIDSFVRAQGDSHTASDVLRVIRDASHLSYERQLVSDALDADPLAQLEEVRDQVQRIQKLLEVSSCTRLVTLEDLCSIHAAVRLKRDNHMDKDGVHVKDHVQLSFHYERQRAPEQQEGTHVLYRIDAGKDHGPQERILTIEVWAAGRGPSQDPPLPIDIDEEEDWEDMSQEEDDDDEGDAGPLEEDCVEASTKDAVMSKTGEARDRCEDEQPRDQDRYAAYLDPDVLTDFLTWTNLHMDEYTAFCLLMTFPFYEHEWDLIGCVFESVFEMDMDARGNEDDDDELSGNGDQSQ